MKKIMAVIMCFVFTLSLIQVGKVEAAVLPFRIELNGKIVDYVNPTINVTIVGKPINTGDMPALAIENRTLLPAREFFESDPINAKVEWISISQEVHITYKDKYIVLKIDDETAFVNGVATKLDVPATIIRDVNVKYGKTMVPLRFISEALGFTVEWINETFTANVTPPTTGNGNNTATSWSVSDALMKQVLTQQDKVAIEAKDLPLASITGITTDNKLGETYRIAMNAPVSNIKVSKWEGMLILDIENATRNINIGNYEYSKSIFVKGIRTSQFKINPMVVRCVFDFNTMPDTYNVSLSSDRKEVILSIPTNKILAVEASKDNKGDYLQIVSTLAPNIITSRLESPSSIAFDIENSTLLVGAQETNIEGQFIKKVRLGQLNETTVRIVGEVAEQTAYSIHQTVTDVVINAKTYKIHTSIIRLKALEDVVIPPVTPPNTGENEEVDGTVFRLPLPAGITLDMITTVEDYYNNKYIITIPNNYLEFYNNQKIVIDNLLVTNVNYGLTFEGNTQVTITADAVYVYTVRIEGQKLRINIRKPRDVYSKIVVVDPGHGGNIPGAVYDNIKEKDLNYKIFKYLKEIAQEQDEIKVYYTRLDDTDPSFDLRSRMAAKVGADIFISIHNNALKTNTSVKGTIVFYQQNQTGTMNTLSKGLATIMQKTVTNSAGTFDKGIRTENFIVLRENTVPSVLVECAFMTNITDMANLKNDIFLNRLAVGIWDGMTQYFETYPTGR